ncbi:3'-5' exonuclease [Desulfurispira natronophila]
MPGSEKTAGVKAPLPWSQRFVQLAEEARDPRIKAFYCAGMVDESTPLEEVPLLAMDFETTGFDSSKHGIVSIGLVPMSHRRIHCREARHWVVKPRVALDETSVVIHGITHSDVAAAPDLSDVIDELLEYMAGRVIVVHHRSIERAFLDVALKARTGEGIQFPVIDTMELEARLHRSKAPGIIDWLLRRRPASIRLADSRERYHLPYYRPHHALTDALATAELLQAQIAHRFSPQQAISELWQ